MSLKVKQHQIIFTPTSGVNLFPSGFVQPNSTNTHDIQHPEALVTQLARKTETMIIRLTDNGITISKEEIRSWFVENAHQDITGLTICETLCGIRNKLLNNPNGKEFQVYFKMIKELELYLDGFSSEKIDTWLTDIATTIIQNKFFIEQDRGLLMDEE